MHSVIIKKNILLSRRNKCQNVNIVNNKCNKDGANTKTKGMEE